MIRPSRSPATLLAAVVGALAVAAACGEAASELQKSASPAGSTFVASTAAAAPTSTEPVRFVAIGDTGKGCSSPSDGQCRVASAIERKCANGGCDFVVLLGDNVYDSGASSADDEQFRAKFEAPYAKIALPFYVVLGNHDYGSGGAGLDYAKAQNEVDYTTKSTKWRMPGRTYHFARSNVELVALDTQQQLLGNDAEQRTDAAAWLAQSSATWKIALGHHPYLSNGPHGNAGNYDGLGFLPGVIPAAGKNVKTFLEDVVCGKADLYLCGHDHSRQWLQDTCNGTELAVSGAGAAPTELTGANPTRFQKDTLGFLYVAVNGRTLTAELVDADAKTEFTRTLTK